MEMIEHVGTRIQREFMAWHRENAQRFTIQLRMEARCRDRLDLGFIGITPVVSANLNERGILVYAEKDGNFFDIIADLEAFPLHTPKGYVCKLCEPESRKVYRTRTEFWRSHLFEEFLAWVNGTLSCSSWVRLSSTGDGGTTWATLIKNDNGLAQQDRTFQFIQQLKRIDGKQVCGKSAGDVINILIPLKSESH